MSESACALQGASAGESAAAVDYSACFTEQRFSNGTERTDVSIALQKTVDLDTVDGDKAAAFMAFENERMELREAKKMWYTQRGALLIVVGGLPFSAGLVLDFFSGSADGKRKVGFLWSGWLIGSLAAVGTALVMAGAMFAAFADHDLDEVLSRHHSLAYVINLIFMGCAATLGLALRSPTFILMLLPCVWAFDHRVLDRKAGHPRWTTLTLVVACSMGMPLGQAGWLAQRAAGISGWLAFNNDNNGSLLGTDVGQFSSFDVRLVSAALAVFIVLSVAAIFALYHWHWSRQGLGPTRSGFRCVFASSMVHGFSFMLDAILPFWMSPSWIGSTGFSLFVPSAAYLRYGDLIESALEQGFYRGRRLDDSVFVAEMGQPLRPCVGDSHDWHDPSTRKWHPATVINVFETMFIVELNEGAKTQHTIESGGAGIPAAELRLLALKNLRGVFGNKITLELLQCQKGDDATFALGVECKVGEIDFFVSHSWYDDPKAKHDAIQTVTAAFRSRHGQEPLFWLDKVCIDQSQINQGLRALPIFIASCQRTLVVAGHTYTHRLWCIWELHTLFVCSGAQPDLDLVDICNDTESAAAFYSKLAEFQLDNAHCYDPNEERRLRSAIAAAPGGVQGFETAIRGLASRNDVIESLGINMHMPTDHELTRNAGIDEML